MSGNNGKYQSGRHDVNEHDFLSVLLMTRNGANDCDLSNRCVDDCLSAESFQQSRTSMTGNLHPVLQPIPHVQAWRTVRTEFPMDLDTAGIWCAYDH